MRVCYGAYAMKLTLALACLAGLAVIPVSQRSEKDLSPRERERLMAAVERAAIRERAALEAESVSEDLRATADELLRLSGRAEAAAAAAEKAQAGSTGPGVQLPEKRTRPTRAEQRAAERESAGPGRAPRSAVSPGGGRAVHTRVPRPRPLPLQALSIEQALAMVPPIHAAATRSAAENKLAYLPKKRAARSRSNPRTRGTGQSFGPGEAPDIGDVDLYASGGWCVYGASGIPSAGGPAAGTLVKTGNVDLARVTMQPDPGGAAEGKPLGGIRRHNLGDVTVSDCDFTGLRKRPAIYDNVSGHGLYRGNTFLRVEGQAIQLAYRDAPVAGEPADNLPLTAPPLLVLEDNHAVDCGAGADPSGFAWSLLDPGTLEHPGRVIMRGCTLVNGGDATPTEVGGTKRSDRLVASGSSGGLIVDHHGARPEDSPLDTPRYATEIFVVDACLFDITKGSAPVMALRGVGTILIEDSCFIARDHLDPTVHVDDIAGPPSGTIILENCVSPKGSVVWLQVRSKPVCSMHCPGKRLVIDVKTLTVTELPMQDDPVSRVKSPLTGRSVRPGIHAQTPGHLDDVGALDFGSVR